MDEDKKNTDINNQVLTEKPSLALEDDIRMYSKTPVGLMMFGGLSPEQMKDANLKAKVHNDIDELRKETGALSNGYEPDLDYKPYDPKEEQLDRTLRDRKEHSYQLTKSDEVLAKKTELDKGDRHEAAQAGVNLEKNGTLYAGVAGLYLLGEMVARTTPSQGKEREQQQGPSPY